MFIADNCYKDLFRNQILFLMSKSHVFISDSALKFVVPLKPDTVELGGTLSLVCELNQASGDVVWQHDRREIKPGGRYSVRTDGAKRVLTVTGMTKEDEGEYSCECRNDKTSAKVSSKGN